jgi:hypothetical protein
MFSLFLVFLARVFSVHLYAGCIHAGGVGWGLVCYTLRCGGNKICRSDMDPSGSQLLLPCGQANEVCAAAQPNECEGGSDATLNTR